MDNTLDAAKVRTFLGGMGVYPTQLGIDSMSEPCERKAARKALRQWVAMLTDGDLFCLYLLASILVER